MAKGRAKDIGRFIKTGGRASPAFWTAWRRRLPTLGLCFII